MPHNREPNANTLIWCNEFVYIYIGFFKPIFHKPALLTHPDLLKGWNPTTELFFGMYEYLNVLCNCFFLAVLCKSWIISNFFFCCLISCLVWGHPSKDTLLGNIIEQSVSIFQWKMCVIRSVTGFETWFLILDWSFPMHANQNTYWIHLIIVWNLKWWTVFSTSANRYHCFYNLTRSYCHILIVLMPE